MSSNVHLHGRQDHRQGTEDEKARRKIPGKVRGIVVVHRQVLPLTKCEKAPQVETDESDLAIVVARRDEGVAVEGHGVDQKRFPAVTRLADGCFDTLGGGLERVLELADKVTPGFPLDGAGDELLLLRDVQVGLVLYEARICPKEPVGLPGQVADAESRVNELSLVKGMAEQPRRQGLDEDSARVCDKVQVGLLRDDYLAALESLVVQWADVAWLGRQKENGVDIPQPLCR